MTRRDRGARRATLAAVRSTFDERSLLVWTDGSVTVGGFEVVPPGEYGVAWQLAGEAGIYDAAEIPTFVRVYRRIVNSGMSPCPGVVRCAVARELEA